VQALTDEQLERYRRGVRGEKGPYRLVDWKRLDERRVLLVLEEGRNREIREVLRIFGVQVRHVHRSRIGPVTVRGLAPGQFRPMSPREVAWFLHPRPEGGERGV
jgi:23S rRNA pseudouridine2605 synthase